jgi:hypothetical protein
MISSMKNVVVPNSRAAPSARTEIVEGVTARIVLIGYKSRLLEYIYIGHWTIRFRAAVATHLNYGLPSSGSNKGFVGFTDADPD